MNTKADEEPIRLSLDRVRKLRDRMRAASIARDVPQLQPELEPSRLEYEARCDARAIIHEHTANELKRGAEWELALSVLAQPFDYDEYNFDDQLANSMLGIDFLIDGY